MVDASSTTSLELMREMRANKKYNLCMDATIIGFHYLQPK